MLFLEDIGIFAGFAGFLALSICLLCLFLAVRKAARGNATLYRLWTRFSMAVRRVCYRLGLFPRWRASEIAPGLWLGSANDAINLRELRRRRIGRVLTIASGCVPQHPDHLEYLYFDALDVPHQPLGHLIRPAIEFISLGTPQDPVLVHCMAGISRSASLVIAFLMYKHSWILSDALSFVKAKRPIVHPNPGFLTQLQGFEVEIKQNKE